MSIMNDKENEMKKAVMKLSRQRLVYHNYAEQFDRDILEVHRLSMIRPEWGSGWLEFGEDVLTYLEIIPSQYHCETDWKKEDYLTLDAIFRRERIGARIVCGWDDKLEEIFDSILKWSVEKWASYWEISVDDAEKYLIYKLSLIDVLLDYKWSKDSSFQEFNLKSLLKHE